MQIVAPGRRCYFLFIHTCTAFCMIGRFVWNIPIEQHAGRSDSANCYASDMWVNAASVARPAIICLVLCRVYFDLRTNGGALILLGRYYLQIYVSDLYSDLRDRRRAS